MLPWLDPDDDLDPFPPINLALKDPDGLLAAGGSLRPERLLEAYRSGIFPWFDEQQPILWWSPDPRLTLKPSALHISRSLAKFINKQSYHCTIDQAFDRVIAACSAPREQQDGSWITDSMIEAYQQLFELGYAHSVEVWLGEELIGGLYGVSIGQVFFGESMFSRQSNASKVGFTFLCQHLAEWGCQVVDCQVHSDHLESLGAAAITRDSFIQLLEQYCPRQLSRTAWQVE
ncbi:MAG: leucyl/phenylalanyl-tRNA--protein transferase [Cycloclasticus sp.]